MGLCRCQTLTVLGHAATTFQGNCCCCCMITAWSWSSTTQKTICVLPTKKSWAWCWRHSCCHCCCHVSYHCTVPAAHGYASNLIQIAALLQCNQGFWCWGEQYTNADKNDAGKRWSESGSVADTLMLIPMLMLILMPSLMVMLPNTPALMLSLCHIAYNPPPSSSSARSPPAPNQSHTPTPHPHQRSLPKTPTRG